MYQLTKVLSNTLSHMTHVGMCHMTKGIGEDLYKLIQHVSYD
jgi:alpha-galactosidase/6-phospho-beta-glucosidase family protein